MPPPTFDEPRKLYAVEWRSVFPVLHLLRAFRIALHPSKLLLGLTFILLLYGVGRLLDGMWPRAYSHPAVSLTDSVLPMTLGVAEKARRSGPFDVLLKWQLDQLHTLTSAVWEMNVGLGFGAIKGFVVDGPVWVFTTHPLFAVLFSLALLVCWAIFGGALARIAAVHVTRDEKISIRNALRFSVGKLLSFIFAPLILGVFVIGVGAVIALSTLLMYVPQVGPLAVGAIFVVVLIAGFILTLTLFGALGGFGLMYPTVAVEGSDAFDAISTSFSYFFAQPLRLFTYSVLALIYGALTYMLAKWFVFVMFTLVHGFQTWFLSEGTSSTPGMVAKFNEFFPPPALDSLSYNLDYDRIGKQLGTGAKIGASVISFWYYLVVGLLGAYVLSYYFSASTIIYTLLRHDVERTELDDVYLEHEDEEDLAEQALRDAPVTPTSGAGASASLPDPGPTPVTPPAA